MKNLPLLLVSLFLIHTVYSENPPGSRDIALEQKLNQSTTQTELNMSSSELASYLTEKLKSLEERQSKRMIVETRTVFHQSCDKWKNWRDAEAEFAAFSYEGGTMHSLVYNTAIIELTKRRIAQIEDIDPAILLDEN